MDYVIGLDIGTQSTKALLCDGDGRIVSQHSSAYHPDTPKPLWAEQDAHVWLEAVKECLREAAAKAARAVPGFDPEMVRAVCISSLYGGAGIPVDDGMSPLYPCLIWMDRRAEAEVDWVRANVDLDRLRSVTGNHVDSYYGFTKILWIRNNRPDVWERTRYLLPPNAWVIHQLTGELAVDHSSAGNIGGVYDLAVRFWSSEMMYVLEEAAKNIAAGADGLVFLPYLMGERSPVWDGKASGAFVGLSLYHTRAHCYRAVLEGVALALRHNIEAGSTDMLDRELIVVGGAAHSPLWVQIIADVTGRPVYTIAEDVEAAMGAALLAALGAGVIDNEAAGRGWVSLRLQAEPRVEAVTAYDKLFAIYADLYPALKQSMHALRAAEGSK